MQRDRLGQTECTDLVYGYSASRRRKNTSPFQETTLETQNIFVMVSSTIYYRVWSCHVLQDVAGPVAGGRFLAENLNNVDVDGRSRAICSSSHECRLPQSGDCQTPQSQSKKSCVMSYKMLQALWLWLHRCCLFLVLATCEMWVWYSYRRRYASYHYIYIDIYTMHHAPCTIHHTPASPCC